MVGGSHRVLRLLPPLKLVILLKVALNTKNQINLNSSSSHQYMTCSRHNIQLTLVISNSMGPWKKFESTIVRLKRSYENTGSIVCLTTKGRQLERNFEELKPASHVPILGTILNIFDVFVAVFFSLLNSLNLAEQLITSRYLFLCV